MVSFSDTTQVTSIIYTLFINQSKIRRQDIDVDRPSYRSFSTLKLSSSPPISTSMSISMSMSYPFTLKRGFVRGVSTPLFYKFVSFHFLNRSKNQLNVVKLKYCFVSNQTQRLFRSLHKYPHD